MCGLKDARPPLILRKGYRNASLQYKVSASGLELGVKKYNFLRYYKKIGASVKSCSLESRVSSPILSYALKLNKKYDRTKANWILRLY